MNKRIAVYPGSFDPITNGHLDIISRAAGLFDEVIVVVSANPQKNVLFSAEERVQMIEKSSAAACLQNVRADAFYGLLVDYFRAADANVIIKGLRAMSDFEYEFQMALINKDLYNGAETVFLCAGAAYTFLSSSAVKQISLFGGDVSGFVPSVILSDIKAKLAGAQKSAQNSDKNFENLAQTT